MKLKYLFLSGLSLIVMLLISCQVRTEPIPRILPTVTNTSIPQQTVGIITTPTIQETTIATVTVETISTPIPAASATTVLTTAILLSPTPAIVTTTIIPIPTLEGDVLETRVAELLENPMDCDVPCWWRAIPGVTNIDEVKHTISPYNFDIYEYYDEEGGTYLRLGIGGRTEGGDFKTRMVYSFSNSVLVGVTAHIPSITDFLAKYDQPDEVWFSVMNDSRDQYPTVWFVIVYLQEGMGVGYAVNGDRQGDIITGCVADTLNPLQLLRMVIPESVTDYKDFTGGIFSEELHYIPLEVATGLTVEGFVQLFSNPVQPQCVETPIELWE